MKNNKYQIAGCGLGAALLLLGLSASAQPFSNPAGTLWDCTMSGGRDGLAVLFFDDKTNSFTMTEIIVPKKPAPFNDSRGTISDGRNGDTGTTPFRSVDLFGGGSVTGPWNIDANGHIVGFWTEPGGDILNQFSFTGTMVPGKRLTLNVKSTVGNMVYRGKPSTSLGDLSGQYYGTLSQAGRQYTDFFTLSNPGIGSHSVDPSDNIYDLNGSGPGYVYDSTSYSFAIISAWKKVAYTALLGSPTETNIVRAVVGSFSLKTGRGNTSGMQQSDLVSTNRVSFKSFMIQSVTN
jgi:hypothetical protein